MVDTAIDVLKILEQNMKTQQDNMQWIIEGTDAKIVEATQDQSVLGRINKRDTISQLLDNERGVKSRISVYKEVEEWASNAIKAIEQKGAVVAIEEAKNNH